MAGLSAAIKLDQAGRDVVLIEAQSRVGGRVCSEQDVQGQPVELGAQAFNRDMKTLARAARAHGLNRAPLHNMGEVIYDGIEGADSRRATEQLEALLDANGPEFKALGHRPDTSVADAVDLLSPDDSTRQMMDSYVQELWGRPMDRLQFAHAVEVSDRYSSNRDDWEFQLIEGFGALAERMAATLGDRLVLNTPVTRIETEDQAVKVQCAQSSIQAKAVIVAVPPTVAQRFIPESHASFDALSAYEAGDLIKLVIQYENTFWRRDGYSGESVSITLPGFATADGTLSGGGRPALVVFIGGTQARAFSALSQNERWQLIQSKLVELFGEEAGKPTEWNEKIWVDDPWVGGAYNAHVSPGAMLKADTQLRRFEDRITCACAEIAERFPGYVEGAMIEGEKAAERVLSGLGYRAETKSSPGLFSKLKRLLGG